MDESVPPDTGKISLKVSCTLRFFTKILKEQIRVLVLT